MLLSLKEFWTEATFYKLLKFGAVGLSGVVVDFAFTYFFKEIVKIQKYVANCIGFTVAATTNYILNRIWTFNSHNPDIAVEYLRFFIVSLLGLGINSLVLWLLVSKFRWNFYFSKLIAIGVTMIWNFIANLVYTFH